MAPAQSDTEPTVIKTTGYNMEGDGGPCTGPALAQSDAAPIERARYHLQKADHALHDVEGDPFADHAHTLVHEAAFFITDEPELQALRKLPAQSNAEPAPPQTLRDAAENLLLAIGMGWDLDGCVENLRTALAQSNVDDPGDATWRNLKKRMDMGTKEAIAALGQRDAEPVAWRWRYKSAPDEPGEWHAALAEFYGDDLIVEPLYTAPPRPDESAKDVATKIASRPALAKLIDTGALQFSEMCDLRDDIEKALRSRPDASAGLIEAAEFAEQCANGSFSKNEAMYLRGFADRLRTRAADRSGK